ncbi:MAG: Holliday junction branch migration protein RuvA, partial [Ignavibacteriales bacterium]|nr:Holliday junction branch migration protein RuvA [Ignavibacteriales bacterium]
NEALMALTSLGYPRQAAEKALRQVLNESVDKQLTVEELLKRTLRFLS